MRISALIAIPLFLLFSSRNHSATGSSENEHTISVTGSSEMSVVPDEVELTISIREYFEEEYIPGKRIEDYKTKVPLRNIESEFYKHLESIGYSKKDLTLLGAGDFWRNAGLPVQFSKQFSICVPGLEQIEKLVQALDMRGVESVSIRQLKNKKLTALRKQVKIQALEMAKEKAAYLLESQGHKAGSLVSIREVNNDNGFSYSYSTSNMLSNSVSFSDNKSGLQSISIRYEIEVSYLID